MIQVGKKAPEFTLPTHQGKKLRLKDLKGKKVVLYFYPKDNTSGCTKEACSFNENLAILEQTGAIVVGVSADSLVSHKNFAEKYGLQFPLISDENKEMVNDYGVWKQKSMYGRKYFGIERTTFILDEKGVIRHIFNKVKVEGHVDVVLRVLQT